ncbi:magnesium/cobalt transporter CorA [Chloroflexota bacterium]
MSLKAYYLNHQGTLLRDQSEDEMRTAFESKQGLLWVDIEGITEADTALLERIFKFHHLALEDCISPKIHPPKIDDFDDYLFILAHGINHAVESEIVETAELVIFLGTNFVVSNHDNHLYSVESVQRMVEADGRPMKRGADFLAHALIDALVDNVLPTVDKMSDIAEEIEEEVIHNPRQATLEAILKLKRSTLRIHRVMAPQREVLNRLSRGEFPVIKTEAQIFYRDVYDHLVRIEDLNQNIRDRADNALSTYLSSVANRQNETMRVLSIVATIFMPLTLLVGIYGMNFVYMPELEWRWGYFVVLGIMGVVIISLMWRFWASRWIGWGRKQVSRVSPFAVEPEKLIGYIGHLAKHPMQRKK